MLNTQGPIMLDSLYSLYQAFTINLCTGLTNFLVIKQNVCNVLI